MLFDAKVGDCTAMRSFTGQQIYFKIDQCIHKESYTIGQYTDSSCNQLAPRGMLQGKNAKCSEIPDESIEQNSFFWATVEVPAQDDYIIDQQVTQIEDQRDEFNEL